MGGGRRWVAGASRLLSTLVTWPSDPPHPHPPRGTPCRLLQELADDDFCMDDGHRLKPREVYAYLCRVLYNRRNKWVGGMPTQPEQ